MKEWSVGMIMEEKEPADAYPMLGAIDLLKHHQ